MYSCPPLKSTSKRGKNEYAVVYIDGNKTNLGRWGSPEVKAAYAQFEVKWRENHQRPVAERVPPMSPGSGEKTDATACEADLAFLQYVEAAKSYPNNVVRFRFQFQRILAVWSTSVFNDFINRYFSKT